CYNVPQHLVTKDTVMITICPIDRLYALMSLLRPLKNSLEDGRGLDDLLDTQTTWIQHDYREIRDESRNEVIDLSKKVIRKEVLFVVDISGSMKGRTIEATKIAVVAAMSKLDQGDSFNVMAFNDKTYLYSSTLELATTKALQKKCHAEEPLADLPEELSRVHNTFYVSNLKKCHADEPLVVPLDGLHFDDKLHFVEEPVEIADHEVKRLKRSRIPLFKV
nr:hypothetical protein [Tanacetum cinerariifolium]